MIKQIKSSNPAISGTVAVSVQCYPDSYLKIRESPKSYSISGAIGSTNIVTLNHVAEKDVYAAVVNVEAEVKMSLEDIVDHNVGILFELLTAGYQL